MANTQMGPIDVGFINSLKAVADMGSDDSGLNTPVNYTSISALRDRLQTINAAYYTDEMLNRMTVNDMVFALRNEDDPTTIADYMA